MQIDYSIAPLIRMIADSLLTYYVAINMRIDLSGIIGRRFLPGRWEIKECRHVKARAIKSIVQILKSEVDCFKCYESKINNHVDTN